MNNNDSKVPYILIIVLSLIITNALYVELADIKKIDILIPMYLISSVGLLFSIIMVIFNNKNKLIKIINTFTVSTFIITMISTQFKNMIYIINNLNIVSTQDFRLYDVSYVILIMSFFLLFAFTKKNILRDVIFSLCIIIISILFLSMEILLKKYNVVPLFSSTVYLENVVQFIIVTLYVSFVIYDYLTRSNNKKIIMILNYLFYIITLVVSFIQTIRINDYVKPK